MIRVFSIHFNRPDFIKYQLDTLSKFSKEEFEFIVVNNGIDDFKNQNKDVCDFFKIKCVEVKNPNHLLGGLSHQAAMSEILELCVRYYKNDIVLLLDFDIFPIETFSFHEYVNIDHPICGIPQSRNHVFYFWPGILFFDFSNLLNIDRIDLRGTLIEEQLTDSGGNLYYYLKEYPNLKYKQLHDNKLDDYDNSNYFNKLDQNLKSTYNSDYELYLIDGKFIHFGRGSNWNYKNKDYMNSKNSYIYNLLNIKIN